ncbi:hypothetical protein Vadar_006295 [Vaccinium darrowii]|nr:hypothetical protein Vadar_006295 [Vaccinium darrowii]
MASIVRDQAKILPERNKRLTLPDFFENGTYGYDTGFTPLDGTFHAKIHDAIKVTSSDELQKVILLAFQVVKKSIKVRKMARHLVERCSIIAWLSSIVSVFCGKQYQALTNLSRGPLNTALEVVNDVISNRNIIEWLQQFALEQLSELSTHLYKLLVGGNLTDENVHLVTSVLEILTSTLKISQERKVQDKLLMFVRWATSTALQSSSVKELQPTEAYCHSAILLEREQSEDSLLSKLLRWLTASVILGRLSLTFEKSNLETLHSLLELDKKGRGESQFGFGCEEILAACIFGLQQLLGMGCRLLPSVVRHTYMVTNPFFCAPTV